MDLRINPFYILGVTIKDCRKDIVAAAEERSLTFDNKMCLDALATLTNPQKRIVAELEWLIDCSDVQIVDIISNLDGCACYEEYEPDLSAFCSLTQFNIARTFIYKIESDDIVKVKHFILVLNRLYDNINSEEILNQINQFRRLSGFPLIESKQDVDGSLRNIKNEVVGELNRKLKEFPTVDYINLITLLSEFFAKNCSQRSHQIIEDIITDYKIDAVPGLLGMEKEIVQLSEFIIRGINDINIDDAINDLNWALQMWGRQIKPIQIYYTAIGSLDKESRNIFNVVRRFNIKLYNDYNCRLQAEKILNTMNEIFVDLPVEREILKQDQIAIHR